MVAKFDCLAQPDHEDFREECVVQSFLVRVGSAGVSESDIEKLFLNIFETRPLRDGILFYNGR